MELLVDYRGVFLCHASVVNIFAQQTIENQFGTGLGLKVTDCNVFIYKKHHDFLIVVQKIVEYVNKMTYSTGFNDQKHGPFFKHVVNNGYRTKYSKQYLGHGFPIRKCSYNLM